MEEQKPIEFFPFFIFCAMMALVFFCEFWDTSTTKDDHRVEAINHNSIRSTNSGLRLTRVENVNESARNQLEIVNQQSQQSLEYETTIPGNESSDLPPTYEECMRSS